MGKEKAMEMATGTAPEVVNAPVSGVVGDPAEPVTPQPPPIDSERFAKIAAKEAKLAKERESLKQQMAAHEAEKQKLLDVKRQIDEFEALKKTDPVKAFESLGFTQTDFVNWLGEKNQEPTPEQIAQKAADERIEKFRQEQLAKEKAAADERDNKALDGFKSQIVKSIESESEKFAFCNHQIADAQGIIFETVLEYIKDDPKLAPHEAMKLAIEDVEKYLEEDFLEMAKLKKPAAPVVETPKDEPLKAEVSPRSTPTQRNRVLADQNVIKKQIPTLSSKATATAAATASKRETPSEKKERLMQWLRSGQKPN